MWCCVFWLTVAKISQPPPLYLLHWSWRQQVHLKYLYLHTCHIPENSNPIITALATSSLTIHIAPEVIFVVKVKTTCWNLYQQICHRQSRPVLLKKNNVVQQLMYINYTIQELEKIVHTVLQHTRKEVASNVATCTTNQKWNCGLTEYTSLLFCPNVYNVATEMHMGIVSFVLLFHNIIFLFSVYLSHDSCIRTCPS